MMKKITGSNKGIIIFSLVLFTLLNSQCSSTKRSTSDKVNKTSPNQELPFELNLTDPHTILMMAEKQPEFPGGENARIKFLTENIIYPEKSSINRISGTVFSCFVVEKDGTISEIRILKGVNEEMDNEVIRVIKLMPKWKPGMQDGEPVRVLYSMPIKFCL